jgi:hypothetical protein
MLQNHYFFNGATKQNRTADLRVTNIIIVFRMIADTQ